MGFRRMRAKGFHSKEKGSQSRPKREVLKTTSSELLASRSSSFVLFAAIKPTNASSPQPLGGGCALLTELPLRSIASTAVDAAAAKETAAPTGRRTTKATTTTSYNILTAPWRAMSLIYPSIMFGTMLIS